MPELDALKEDFLLLAALNGQFQARKSALSFRRDLSPPEEKDKLGRQLFELRIQAEQAAQWLERLWQGKGVLAAGGAPAADQALALGYAESLAADLESRASVVASVVAKKAAGLSRPDFLSLATAMHRLASLDDNLQKAYFSAASRGLKPTELQERLGSGTDSEAVHQAIRRYQGLLEKDGDWDQSERELILRRSASLPGRLRLHAVELRRLARRHNGKDALSAHSLDAGAMRLWASQGLDGDGAAAWLAAGFQAEEAKAWRGAGLADVAAALGWKCQGLKPEAAPAWAEAEINPDEAVCLLYAGASAPDKARSLLSALGSVEQVLAWAKAGIPVDQALELRAKGAKTLEQALSIRKMLGAKQTGAYHPGPIDESPALPALPGMAPSLPMAEAKPAPAAAAHEAAPAPSALSDADLKAWDQAGVHHASDAQSWAAGGFTPDSAKPWLQAGQGPRLASAWVRAGVADPSRVASLRELGVASGDDLELLSSRAARLGFDPSQLSPAELAAPETRLPPALLYWGQACGRGPDAWQPPQSGEACPAAWLKRLRRTGDARSVRLLGAMLGADAEEAYIAATECGAREHAVALTDLDPLRDWKENIASLAKALGLAEGAACWRLSGPAAPSPGCLPAVFWGLAFDEPKLLPWASAMDFDEREAWPKRWARRAEDLGFDDDVPSCILGSLPSPEGPRYVVALASSLRTGKPGATVELPPFSIAQRWKDALEDYCTVMEIPWKGPRWWLAYADFGEGAR